MQVVQTFRQVDSGSSQYELKSRDSRVAKAKADSRSSSDPLKNETSHDRIHVSSNAAGFDPRQGRRLKLRLNGKLRAALEAADATLGRLDGSPIVVPVEIEGDLDLIEPQIHAKSDAKLLTGLSGSVKYLV